MRALLLLLQLLFPFATDAGAEADPDEGAAGDDDGAGGDDDAGDDDAGDGEGSDLDAGGDGATGSVPAKPAAQSDEAKEAIRLAREAQEAVTRLTQAAAPRRVDPTWEAEEARLKDPKIEPLERWQIESNRAMRQNAMQSQQAVFAAQDIADKTGYQAKAISDPLYKKYSQRVEEELARARQNGGNPPREMVLAVLIGKDALAGSYKPKSSKGTGTQVPRGKTPGARSDTQARGGQSESAKRRARLENVLI